LPDLELRTVFHHEDLPHHLDTVGYYANADGQLFSQQMANHLHQMYDLLSEKERFYIFELQGTVTY
jgi:hypothetical protein